MIKKNFYNAKIGLKKHKQVLSNEKKCSSNGWEIFAYEIALKMHKKCNIFKIFFFLVRLIIIINSNVIVITNSTNFKI